MSRGIGRREGWGQGRLDFEEMVLDGGRSLDLSVER